MLAEKERLRYQAEESAKREFEENIRFQQEEIYRNIVQTDHSATTKYLENILIDCFDKSAEADARAKIRDVIQYINESGHQSFSQCVAAEIVSETILPQLFGEIEIRSNAERNENVRNTAAVKNVVYDIIEQAIGSITSGNAADEIPELQLSHRSNEENAQLSTILSDIKQKLLEYGTYDTTASDISLPIETESNDESPHSTD